MVLATPHVALPSMAGLFKDKPAEAEYVESLVQRLTTELNSRARDDAARPNVMLQSPGGAVWSVYVNDDGTVGATKVRG